MFSSFLILSKVFSHVTPLPISAKWIDCAEKLKLLMVVKEEYVFSYYQQ